ncbi:MAG: hypothetical protein KDC28_18090 [Saprospiraceae bacterium]|nr:hypothetical protein [Saprospiraceae bacterium]
MLFLSLKKKDNEIKMKPERIRTLKDLATAKKQLKIESAHTRGLIQENLANAGRQAFLHYLLPLGVSGLVAWGVKKFTAGDKHGEHAFADSDQDQASHSPKPIVEGIRVASKVISALLPAVLSLIESYQTAEEE